jgi:spermidine synthase
MVLWAVFLLSAAALGFEILLMRLFSIEQWHHFAYMIISVALLGYGASGTFLCFTKEWLANRFHLAFTVCAALFAVSAPAGFALAQGIPLNFLEIIWDRQQQVFLLGVYLLLALPFFFAATAIGLALARRQEEIGLVYRSDLAGAGVGAAGIVLALFVLSCEDSLKLVGVFGLAAAALASWTGSIHRAVPVSLMIAGLALPVLWPDGWGRPNPSSYKELSLALTVPGAEVVAERSSPLGLLTVVQNSRIPLRHAPGLSLNSVREPPRQLAVFTDGGAMSAITRFDGDLESIAYLDDVSSALAYHLLERPRVLILGSGGGSDVLQARFHHAGTIDAVEINPDMVELVREDYAAFAGNILSLPGTRVHIAEARAFTTASSGEYDLIHVSLFDSFSAGAAGLHALNESTLYTVEAFETYLDKLAPGGVLSITRWLKVPPRDGLKVFATAVEALARRGVEKSERSLALIRSWKTVTLVVKNGDLSRQDIETIRGFCRKRSFDVAYYPGMKAFEANRFNILDSPFFHQGARALIGPGRERYIDDYPFNISPSTDDRPYFFHFLKWRGVSELLNRKGSAGLQLLEWGYLILVATLLQAAVAGSLLVLLPLAAFRRETARPPMVRFQVMVFFLILGLAFLAVEIASIQRFVLFLGHPQYAASSVVGCFLVFAGLGSGHAPSLLRRLKGSTTKAIRIAVTGIALFGAFHLFALPSLFEAFSEAPQAAKVIVSLMVIAPLAFFMGMPFPLGLSRLAETAREMVPWAWGVNGCASVLSATLSVFLAIHLGFSALVAVALLLYGGAAFVSARWRL